MLTIQNLKSKIAQSPYQAYVYSYPHKTAYRPFSPPVYLPELWTQQDRQALFLYIHIPFCEMRCGFCNLFTTVSHNEDFMSQYVRTVQRQAQQMKAVLGDASFARFAIGGGTPTQLPIQHLETILDIAENTMGVKLQEIPISVEVSPETATEDKLRLLRSHAVDRVSIGVQSFIESEVLATQRRQSNTQVEAALTRIKEAGFSTLNIDLIYGLPGQTVNTWLQSIHAALRFQPEEIYLYPLYVRPLTGLGRTDKEWDDIRLACYREGRSLLLSQGYTQVSMRMFRQGEQGNNISPLSPPSPVYCCQADGMVGLGCGARSYTDTLHYSNEYAVGAKGISEILQAYIQTPDELFEYAHYGFQLDAEEQRRRYILLSLLSNEGLNLISYRQRFGSEVDTDFPEFSELLALNLAIKDEDILQLTEFGIERSDTIGAWLFSEKVQELMQGYELK
ncbi:STM4012 family radical SAM protein [Nostoc sp. 'Lobaria pulmonaria (5183) cyanobiont']|uniref:STM4012 family radical SAM protein n=1 Tax=Nostoc sp. 'Lobaria pulmonaria (5183) cyanobiont' TaxID=1618022 RepID=UPI000CF327F9|nr:STM4012 family radical SAM protein [Nostoc sp. 'Lobaria pulmonaria (5183) cyanobiont']AVH71460.1 coproporphyrinogen III oxidase [Nostoc sp. 'Lobaria pulmonaria (5183) cyanobiont']